MSWPCHPNPFGGDYILPNTVFSFVERLFHLAYQVEKPPTAGVFFFSADKLQESAPCLLNRSLLCQPWTFSSLASLLLAAANSVKDLHVQYTH